MKTFLSLSLIGFLVAGGGVGALVDPSGEPVQDGLLIGLGLWIVGIGIALRHEAP